jgi:hypothetical protein
MKSAATLCDFIQIDPISPAVIICIDKFNNPVSIIAGLDAVPQYRFARESGVPQQRTQIF